MRSPHRCLLSILAVLLVLAFSASAGSDRSGRPFHLVLTPEADVPPATDPDAEGTATLRINPGQERVCFEIDTSGVENITASHVHRGTSDVAGPVVVPLTMAFDGSAAECVSGDRGVLVEIMQGPSAFYVNVHNDEFPAGVLRAQLA